MSKNRNKSNNGCPSCGHRCSRVCRGTLTALLKDEPLTSLSWVANCNAAGVCSSPISRADSSWRFCDVQNCSVVYFSEDEEKSFRKSELRVPVEVKEKAGERPLCYCFGHSMASIKRELLSGGTSTVVEDIRA